MNSSLPKEYCITGYNPKNKYEFIQKLISIISNKTYTMIQVRSKHFNKLEYKYIIQSIIDLANENDIKIILNSDMIDGDTYNAHGVHHTRTSMKLYTKEKYGNLILGKSCHKKQDIIQSNNYSLDYIMLSPILKTRSHKNAQPLGWSKSKELIELSNYNVYALGGVNSQHLKNIEEINGYGVAGIEGFWG
jgi:8-oxo-dGTP diphosphatase